MAEYIEREVAIKLIAEDRVELTPMHLAIGNAVGGYTIEQVFDSINQACDRHIEFIKSVPSADVQPVKHGRWIPSEYSELVYACSECMGNILATTDYCPRCGARMDGET